MELYADELELGAGEGRREQVRRMLDTAEFLRVQRLGRWHMRTRIFLRRTL